MDLNKDISRSLKKSKKISELQNIIWGDSKTSDPSVRDNALEEYWDLCQGDKDISGLMQEYNIFRENLNDIYMKLINAGVGQWVKGHFVALSALAYGESFYYLLESQRRGQGGGEKFEKVAYDILLYFKEEIPNGELIRRLQLSQHPIKEQERSYFFCGHCGVKNLASHNFCTDCGKPLEVISKVGNKVISKVGNKVEKNKVKKDNFFNEQIWGVFLLFITIIIFITGLHFVNVMSGPVEVANLDTLLHLFATSVGITIIPWIIVLWITRPFRRNINRGAFLFSGFLGMVSLWIGYWLGYSVEASVLPEDARDIFWNAILLSPIWFVIGLLGKFDRKPIKKITNRSKKSGVKKSIITLSFLIFIGYLSFTMIWTGNKFECEVCVEYNGVRSCQEVEGMAKVDTIMTGMNTACAAVTNGRTESIDCSMTQPVKVQCKGIE